MIRLFGLVFALVVGIITAQGVSDVFDGARVIFEMPRE